MFDNQPTSTPPTNLPVEPDDMFKETDAVAPATSAAPERPPDALEAGLLKRKEPSVTVMPPELSRSEAPLPEESLRPPAGTALGVAKEPIIGKIILAIVIILIIAGVAAAGWWWYTKYRGGSTLPATVSGPGVTTPTPVPTPEPSPAPAAPTTNAEVLVEQKSETILFGDPIDTDKDGIDDIREKELSTDPEKQDTDGDGLLDGEEVVLWKTSPLLVDTDSDQLNDGDETALWKTDPLNPDSDQDGHQDGKEVRFGYNPLGSGRLIVATSTPPASP